MLYIVQHCCIWLFMITCLCAWSVTTTSPRTHVAQELQAIYKNLHTRHMSDRCETTDEKDELAISAYPVAYEKAQQIYADIHKTGTESGIYIRKYRSYIYTCSYHILYALALEKTALQRGTIARILQTPQRHKTANTNPYRRSIYPNEAERSQHYIIPMLHPKQYAHWRKITQNVLSETARSHENQLYHELTQCQCTQAYILDAVYMYMKMLRGTLQQHDSNTYQ